MLLSICWWMSGDGNIRRSLASSAHWLLACFQAQFTLLLLIQQALCGPGPTWGTLKVSLYINVCVTFNYHRSPFFSYYLLTQYKYLTLEERKAFIAVILMLCGMNSLWSWGVVSRYLHSKRAEKSFIFHRNLFGILSRAELLNRGSTAKFLRWEPTLSQGTSLVRGTVEKHFPRTALSLADVFSGAVVCAVGMAVMFIVCFSFIEFSDDDFFFFVCAGHSEYTRKK